MNKSSYKNKLVTARITKIMNAATQIFIYVAMFIFLSPRILTEDVER